MRSIRHSMYVLICAITLLATSIVFSSHANAISVYDDAYRNTASLPSGSSDYYGNTCDSIDLSTSWSQYITDESKWSSHSHYNAIAANAKASWNTAFTSGRWGVSTLRSYIFNSTSQYIDRTIVFWTENESLYLEWTSEAVIAKGDYGKMYVAVIDPGKAAVGAPFTCDPIVTSFNSQSEIHVSFQASDTLVKNLFVYTDYTNEPFGYAGVAVPSTYTPLPAKYVALGDSFSSGEGNPSFETGTDSAINKCHRSSHAYPRLLQDSQGLSPMSFVACSGATIDDVLGNSESDDPIGKWDESKQIDALTDDTEVVTITIGGNDVGFKTFATNCALATCAVNSQPYNNIMDEIDINFQDKLEGLYRTILAESGDAEVYVVGYPLLVGDSSSGDCQTFEIVSDLGARAVTNALNSRISAAVDAVRNDPNNVSYMGRLTYVPANSDNSTSPFDERYICSTPPYFNGIDVLHQEYSFHPNSAGHLAYKTIMEAALN